MSSKRNWGVWCEISGGVMGTRAAWMKGEDGGVQEFATEAEAHEVAVTVAEGLRNTGGTRFRYTARRLGD